MKHNCKVSEPIKNNNNSFFDTKNNAFLTKFFEGDGYNGTDKEIKDLAQNVAIFHRVLATYPDKFNYKTNELFFKILTLNEISKIEKILKEKYSLDNFDKNFPFAERPGSPLGVCHGAAPAFGRGDFELRSRSGRQRED